MPGRSFSGAGSADFRLVWATHSVSLVGWHVTRLALTLVLVLWASPLETGLLTAVGNALAHPYV